MGFPKLSMCVGRIFGKFLSLANCLLLPYIQLYLNVLSSYVFRDTPFNHSSDRYAIWRFKTFEFIISLLKCE